MSNLSKFITQVKTEGLSRSNRFSVDITIPPKLRAGAAFIDMSNMMLLCDQVQLPGFNFATTQNRSFGEFREIPYEKLYGDIQISFYLDTNLYAKRFFDDWVNLIQNPITRTFEYYDEYTTLMTIKVEDTNDEARYTTKVYEVYPKTITPIQLDYASREVMKLQVSLQYKYWTSGLPRVPYNGGLAPNEQFI